MSKRVTLRDVAQAAGVSLAAASYATSNSGRLGDDLRSHVIETANRLGYRPNLTARRLRSRDPSVIGVIVADLANPFFIQFVRALETRAWAEGLRIILCDSNENGDREDTYRVLLEEERVSGLIIASVHPGPARLPSAVPTVLFDRTTGDENHDAVVLDNERAAAALVDELHRRGRRKILGLFGDEGVTAKLRTSGYVAAMEAQGSPYCLAQVPFAPADRRRVVQDAILRNPDAEAVIAGDSLVMLEAALCLAGKPSIFLGGFDEAPWLKLFGENLLIIQQPVEKMASAALTLLLDRISGKRGAPQLRVFPGLLILPNR